MKKFFLLIAALLLATCEIIQAQLATDSWALGFGLQYPRFSNINITPLNSNYGGYLSIQRNFTEHIGLRFKPGYSSMQSEFPDPNFGTLKGTTKLLSGDLDLLVNFFPCEPITPYIYGGIGGMYRMLDSVRYTKTLKANALGFEFNAGAGIEWNLSDNWKLITEFSYHITNNSDIDGTVLTTDLSGRDSYLGISLGLLYYFSKGEASKNCQIIKPYSGLTQADKDAIEEMIVRHIPKEVVKEVVVEKPVQTVSAPTEKWILIGVNFDSNSTKLLPESYPIVYDAAKTLLKNTNLNIEIQGYTDNIGAKSYNKTLSQKRADIVKNYLISKGVSADRLKSVGYGESNPIADNKSAQGRSMNRRIEFKILSESGSVQEPTSDYIKSTENPSKKSIQAEPQVIQENFTEKVNENEQNNIKTENPEKVENQEKIPEQVKEEPAPNINPPEEVKPQKQAYHPKTVVSKPANNEKESTTKYFMENLVGIYYPDPAYSLDIVGYSFFTIHGITSDDPTDAPIFRGMYKGIGLGFITFDGNTGINLFAHARLKSNFVFDFGYTFSSSELKGIYYSLGFSFPIQLDKNKSIIIDFGVAEIGSPTPFGRIGLLL